MKKLHFAVLSAIFAIFATAAASDQPTPELEAGYRAGFMCSGVFVAGRAPEDILRDELAGRGDVPGVMDGITVDTANQAVFVEYEGGDVPRLAVYQGRLGTVLLPPGATLADRDALPDADIPMPEGDPATIPWPDGDLLPDAELPAEVDGAALQSAVEAAFSADRYLPSKTIGVVVVYNGQLIAEQYRPTWNMHTQYRTWSTAKSIASALIGILTGAGKLDVSQPAPIPEWREEGDPRGDITIEHLLHMSSGLKSLGSMTLEAYWGGIDTAADAAASEPFKAPGTRWRYSNYDTLLLVKSMREVIGGHEAYLTFPRRALLNRIGMRHTFPETDPYGNFIFSSQVYTTPRDLARFGLFYLNDGVWNGERILPEGWVEYTVRPAPAKPVIGRGYGAQFWLMNHDERVPRDTYTTSGSLGQYCTIVPSRGVVVARMGIDPRAGSKWEQERFVSEILAAITKQP